MQASRSEAVEPQSLRAQFAAADAESRRIQNALHDGVQQDLIAIAVRLQLVRRAAASDAAAALTLLEELSRDVKDALHRLRDLTDGIYPVVLDARGVADALRTAAAELGVAATVETDGLGRHAADVEMAAYRCGLAALENVAGHAGAGARATIRLREVASTIHLEVRDDGVGSDGTSNTFTDSISEARDRVVAMGGRVTIDSRPGQGTCVVAAIPF